MTSVALSYAAIAKARPKIRLSRSGAMSRLDSMSATNHGPSVISP